MTERRAHGYGDSPQRWGAPTPGARHLEAGLVAQFSRQTRTVVPRPRSWPLPAVGESRLEGRQRSSLQSLSVAVSFAGDDRRAYSIGKSYPDMLAARSGYAGTSDELAHVCDAVVRPRSEEEVSQVLEWAADNDVAIVPVGGGTSVVGGIEPIARRDNQCVVSLDVTALARVLDVDRQSRLAHVQAGILGPALEAELARDRLTLGHVPQSFHRSSLGGWIATRSAGQQSLKFGRIDQLVAGLRILTPAGPIHVDALPAHAAGPDLVQLVSGSEGTLGVISRATVRLSARPQVVRFETFAFPTFADGAHAVRCAVQRGLRPGMVRLSDRVETAFSLGSALPGWVPRDAAGQLVRRLGYSDGCLAMVMDAHARGSAGELAAVARVFSAAGGRSVGGMPARSWYRARFVQPLVRDLLVDRGMVVDTLETAVPWNALLDTHAAVRDALRSSLGNGAIVGAHVSHCYRDGASLYFTFLATTAEREQLQVWRDAKQAVAAVLQTHRAAVSHQHGVGVMHARLYEHSRGAPAVEALQALKESLDPRGILNPGKVGMPGDTASALNAVS